MPSKGQAKTNENIYTDNLSIKCVCAFVYSMQIRHIVLFIPFVCIHISVYARKAAWFAKNNQLFSYSVDQTARKFETLSQQ